MTRAYPNMAGFTLIEALLSLALISILVAISLPVYASFQSRNEVDLAAGQLVSLLRRAQVYARGMQNDSAWGVEVQSDNIVLFRGASFASRDTSYDEIVTVPGSTTVSGLAHINFAKFSGTPDTTGQITLTGSFNTRMVTINAKGLVE